MYAQQVMHLFSAALVSVLVHRLFSLKAQGDKWGFTPRFMSDSKQRRMGLEGRWWREDTAVNYLGKSFFISSSSLSQRSTSFSLPSQPWRTGLKVDSNLSSPASSDKLPSRRHLFSTALNASLLLLPRISKNLAERSI